MTSRSGILLAGVLTTQAALTGVLAAAERPARPVAAAPNAAVIYWQAFALLPPPLAEPLMAQFDAAASAPAAPVADELKPTLESFAAALGELHRGARVAACDWNLDFEAGPGCPLPHLAKARTLSQAALLRARLRFAAGKTDEAVADVLAVLKLARDCGGSPLLIALLVDAAIEQPAAEVLAANSHRLSPAQLERLAAAVEALPATPSVADCMRHENRIFGDWMARFIDAEAAAADAPKAGGTILAALFRRMNAGPADAEGNPQLTTSLENLSVADVREALRRALADSEQAAAIAALPAGERHDRWAAFEAAPDATGPTDAHGQAARILFSMFMPAVEKVWQRADEADVRRQLLRLAIKATQHGPDAIRGSSVPGHGPVELRENDGGLELRCQAGWTKSPVVLTVGRPSS